MVIGARSACRALVDGSLEGIRETSPHIVGLVCAITKDVLRARFKLLSAVVGLGGRPGGCEGRSLGP